MVVVVVVLVVAILIQGLTYLGVKFFGIIGLINCISTSLAQEEEEESLQLTESSPILTLKVSALSISLLYDIPLGIVILLTIIIWSLSMNTEIVLS